MSRHYEDWLTAFCDYAQHGEAPRRMYFWAGVSAVAGALRRKVWIDEAYFKWYCNMYIVFVAPPGIVSKSTTANVAMRLLKEVPGITFGPSVVTWQALVSAFTEVHELFPLDKEFIPMSALTIQSSEFGNLLQPDNKEMVDMLVHLWDGESFEKKTKMAGDDMVVNPWINIIASTTPSWIAGNFPEYMIGGGFTSRCLFVFADKKEKLVAYPSQVVPEDHRIKEQRLIADLTHIAQLAGQYKLSAGAREWGTWWYDYHYKNKPIDLDEGRFGGYLARKQTHIHKLAMVLAASQRDKLVIEADDLKLAAKMVTDLERDMPDVFGRIGRNELSMHLDRLVEMVTTRGSIPVAEGYRFLQNYVPSSREYMDLIEGAVKAGLLMISQSPAGFVMKAVPKPGETSVH